MYNRLMQCANDFRLLKSRIETGTLHVDVLLLFPPKTHQTFRLVKLHSLCPYMLSNDVNQDHKKALTVS